MSKFKNVYRIPLPAILNESKPLLKIDPRGRSMRETSVEITEFGNSVLEKKGNVIQWPTKCTKCKKALHDI